MIKRLIPLIALALLAPLCPSAHACAEPGGSPNTLWTTHIQTITPEAGIAGITPVYVEGYCFGNTKDKITVGGHAVTDIISWTDYQIEFVLPADATTGNLVVTSQSYGYDSSLKESACCGEGCSDGEDWPGNGNPAGEDQLCGNDLISPNFTVVTGDPPAAKDIIGAPPPPPQYVSGTWFYSNGGDDVQFDLTQGAQNSDGTWPITGTWTSNLFGGPYAVTGTLDQYGDFTLSNSEYGMCLEYQLLGSGDVTSVGWGYLYNYLSCPAPTQNFFSGLYDESDESAYWESAQPPLFKSETDLPASEVPTFYQWVIYPGSGSQYATYGGWERTLVASPGVATDFSGRFVFEQVGGNGTDTCAAEAPPGDPTPPFTAVSGGGWYVNQNGIWALDAIGIRSQGVTWYQANVSLPCSMTIPQDMHIDARNGDDHYTTNQLIYEIAPTEIYSKIVPEVGAEVQACENYPSLKGKCKP